MITVTTQYSIIENLRSMSMRFHRSTSSSKYFLICTNARVFNVFVLYVYLTVHCIILVLRILGIR